VFKQISDCMHATNAFLKAHSHVGAQEVPRPLLCTIWGSFSGGYGEFSVITPCSPLEVKRRFGGTCCLHLQAVRISQARIQHKAVRKQSDPEDGSDMLLRKVDWLSTDYMVGTELIWLRIGTSTRLLYIGEWTFSFHKLLGNSWVDERLVTSQEGLISVELVTRNYIPEDKNFLLPLPRSQPPYLFL
jgi:hypothetical protein